MNEILSLKPKTKHVKEMIESKYGKFVTLKDIHNLKSRMKTEARGGLHDAQLLLTPTAEDTEHLQKIVQSFKDENSAWSDIDVIVVDKDFTEWKVLKEEWEAGV